jgi:hypothetical protein
MGAAVIYGDIGGKTALVNLKIICFNGKRY